MLTMLDSSNDTSDIYSDTITVSYAWRTGDELLQNGSDFLKREAEELERKQYGNGNSDGL